MKEMNSLDQLSTKILVQELAKREGVAKTTVEPYQELLMTVKGPAVVLQVMD